MLRRIVALVVKELRVLLRDPRSRMVVILPPLVQLIVFANAASFDLYEVPVAVFDEDNSELSRRLIDSLDQSDAFSVEHRIHTEAEARELIDARECVAVVRIPDRLQANYESGVPTRIQLILDARTSNTALLVLSYCQEILGNLLLKLAEEGRFTGSVLQIRARAWYNPNLASRWFFVPGVVALVTLVTSVIVTALSVAREREQLTLERVLVAPFRPVELLVGKTIPGVLIGLFSATLVLSVALLVFRVPFRASLSVLYLCVAAFLMSSVGVGLLVSSLARTQQQALLGAFIVLVPSVILSGFATPVENMPRFFQILAVVDPLLYFVRDIRALFLEGATVGQLSGDLLRMGAIGLAALAVAALVFRRRVT